MVFVCVREIWSFYIILVPIVFMSLPHFATLFPSSCCPSCALKTYLCFSQIVLLHCICLCQSHMILFLQPFFQLQLWPFVRSSLSLFMDTYLCAISRGCLISNVFDYFIYIFFPCSQLCIYLYGACKQVPLMFSSVESIYRPVVKRL